MKAVGQAFEVAFGVGLHETELVTCDISERRAWAIGLADQETGNLPGPVQKLLRNADIDHQHVRHELRLCLQRRQRYAIADRGRGVFRQMEIGKRFRCNQCLSRGRHESLQILSSDRRCIAHFPRQRHWLDAEQSQRPSIDLNATLQNRRYRPAGAAQFDEDFLRECAAIAANQHLGPCAAEHRRRAVVGFARLQIERLHAAPERGRGDQADQQRRKLHRMPPPMAQENREHPDRALHAISPAWSVT